MPENKKTPSQEDAQKAIKTLLAFAGEDPGREGLCDTPARVTRAYAEWFRGYNEDPAEYLKQTFSEISGYQDVVLLRNIELISTCEHHMAPIIGKAHVAYLPNKRVVGLSKIVRVVEIYARRLQLQERLTQEIAHTIDTVLRPHGVAVYIEAAHFCMYTRGVSHADITTTTKVLLGEFSKNPLRAEILTMIQKQDGR